MPHWQDLYPLSSLNTGALQCVALWPIFFCRRLISYMSHLVSGFTYYLYAANSNCFSPPVLSTQSWTSDLCSQLSSDILVWICLLNITCSTQPKNCSLTYRSYHTKDTPFPKLLRLIIAPLTEKSNVDLTPKKKKKSCLPFFMPCLSII